MIPPDRTVEDVGLRASGRSEVQVAAAPGAPVGRAVVHDNRTIITGVREKAFGARHAILELNGIRFAGLIAGDQVAIRMDGTADHHVRARCVIDGRSRVNGPRPDGQAEVDANADRVIRQRCSNRLGRDLRGVYRPRWAEGLNSPCPSSLRRSRKPDWKQRYAARSPRSGSRPCTIRDG